MDGRCHARFFFRPVSSCVVTYSSRSLGEQIFGRGEGGEGGENKARVRGADEKEKRNSGQSERIERKVDVWTKERKKKTPQNIATDRVNLHESFPVRRFLFAPLLSNEGDSEVH